MVEPARSGSAKGSAAAPIKNAAATPANVTARARAPEFTEPMRSASTSPRGNAPMVATVRPMRTIFTSVEPTSGTMASGARAASVTAAAMIGSPVSRCPRTTQLPAAKPPTASHIANSEFTGSAEPTLAGRDTQPATPIMTSATAEPRRSATGAGRSMHATLTPHAGISHLRESESEGGGSPHSRAPARRGTLAT